MRIDATPTLLLRHLAVLTALLALGCGDDDRVETDFGPPQLRDMGGPDQMTDTMCEPGLVDCGDGCTRLAGDSNHCGACGNACPAGFSCAVGRCDCAEPMKSCDGVCTDPAVDNDNCGACGNVCRDGDTCLDGACVVDCEAPKQRCLGSDDEFLCSDTQTDSLNCGVCGAACSSGATCVDGRCACAAGQISCGGTCIDPTTDADHCGNCLTSCGEGGVCMGGACSTCGTGLTACGSPARCTDTDTSRLHCGACGNACGAGAECSGGACTCLPGFTDCDGQCAALMSDRNHCGGCGISCGPLGACSAGVCVCAPEATMCGAECAVLDSDASHCGACDNACGAGEICRDSTCLMLNATCATATPITTDTTITGEDISVGGTRPQGTGCGSSSGDNALYYAVTVPPNMLVNVTTDGSFDRVLVVQDTCGATECTYRTDRSPESATLSNSTGAPITQIVAVHNYSSSTTTGTYDISFQYRSAPTNVSCAAATDITTDTTITGEPIAAGGPRPQGTGCGSSSGDNALYYSVTVPPNAFVNVTTTGSVDRVLLVQDACGATECTYRTDRSPESATLMNSTAAPITQIVAVHNYSSSGSGSFDITFQYGTPPTNVSCAAATDITADTTITGETIAFGGPRPQGTDCGTSSGDNALYYSVTVPPGATVAVTTDGSFDRVLLVQDACGATECTFRTDSSPESTVLYNPGAAPITQIVAVHNYSSSGRGVYDISFTYGTPPTNVSCAAATPITSDTTITGESISFGGPRPQGTGCGTSSGDNALYYAVTVPAGGMVNVTTDGSFDRVLLFQDSCGATECTYRTDSSPESGTLTNTTGAPVTRIVAVHNYFSSGSGSYDITFTYAP